MATTARLRPEDERLPFGSYLAFGLQHVLTMYGGIIAVPLIMGGAAGLPPSEIAILVASCLFIGGLSTILQSVGVPFSGSQLPLVQGSRSRASRRWARSPPAAGSRPSSAR